MNVHTLEVNLDLKQNLNINTNCKQLDTLHLVFNIYDNGVQADLSNYNVRLKAMKSDKVPLIQDTEYTIMNNVVTIITNEQLTSTSGITKVELQFINKTTSEKKATFNLNLKVISSVLEVERSISTATYTLLEELENKMDKALDFFESIDKAIETNTLLISTTNNANITNNTLNTSNANALATRDMLETLNTNAISTKNALEESSVNAKNTKDILEVSNSTSNVIKNNLETENKRAEANIVTMQSFGEVTALSQNVTNIKTEIENARNGEINLGTRLDKFTTKLSDIVNNKANDIDINRTTTVKDVTGAINELNSGKAKQTDLVQLSNPNLLINGGFYIWQRGISGFATSTAKMYTADRWALFKNSWATGATGELYTSANGNEYLIRSQGNVGYSINLQQMFDGPMVKQLRGKRLTFSIKARTGGIGDTTMAMFIAAGKSSGGSIGGAWNYNLSYTTSKWITLDGNSKKYIVASDTVVPADAELLTVYISGNINGTTSEHYIALSEAKLEVGTIATSFSPRGYEEELAICKRYYQTARIGGVAYNTTLLPINFTYPVEMRVSPTIKLSVGLNGTDGQMDAFGTGTIGMSGYSVNSSDAKQFFYIAMPTATFTPGRVYDGYIAADAEIY